MRIETLKEKIMERRRFILNILLLIFVSLFLFSGFHIINWFFDKKNVEQELENISQITTVHEVVVSSDDENVSLYGEEEEKANQSSPYWDYISMDMIDVDFKGLKTENSDTVGWIKVNGTNINYPFVQTSDNTYYLTHSFYKVSNKSGWVFMDYRNNASDFDKNTILYAHNRADSTMFGSLKNTVTDRWLNNTDNHIVKLSTETENTLWQVFSVYHIDVTDDYLQTQFRNDSEFLNFANLLQERSAFKFNTTVSESDKILTLSTCHVSDDERTVLHAKLIKKYTKEP